MISEKAKSVNLTSSAGKGVIFLLILFVLGGAALCAESQLDPAINTDAVVHNVWVDVPITQVLRDISVETGIVIALGPTVPDDIISLDAGTGKPLKQCLEEILAGKGLYVFKKSDNFYLISTGDPDSPGFLEVANSDRIHLKYISAKHLCSCLPRSLQAYVTSGSRPNEILIYAIPEIKKRIMEVIKKLDVPRKQVVLEVLVVEVTEEDQEEFGIDWEYAGKKTSVSLTEGLGAFTNIAKYTSLPQKEFRTVMTTIRSLAKKNKAKIRSRPRVATLNGETASIDISLDEYFSIATDFYGNSLRTELEVIKSGVLLEITPQIGDKGDITVDVLTEVSDVVERQKKVNNGNGESTNRELPVIRRRRADTSVRVKHGDAIVIGGLVESTEEEEKKKVPFFGDIPVIGNIFKSEKKEKVNKEVVIFITPKYVNQKEKKIQDYWSDTVDIEEGVNLREDILELLSEEGEVYQSRETDEEEKINDGHKRIAIEKEIELLTEVANTLKENNEKFYADFK